MSNTQGWDESLLQHLVDELSQRCWYMLPNLNINNVAENIADLALADDFPHELASIAPKSPTPTKLSMTTQGRCPPWVHEIAPIVFELLRKKKGKKAPPANGHFSHPSIPKHPTFELPNFHDTLREQIREARAQFKILYPHITARSKSKGIKKRSQPQAKFQYTTTSAQIPKLSKQGSVKEKSTSNKQQSKSYKGSWVRVSHTKSMFSFASNDERSTNTC